MVRFSICTMTSRTTISLLIFLSTLGMGCGKDPVVGSWKGSKQNLLFDSNGKLRSLESAAIASANAESCESAGLVEAVDECNHGGWTTQGEGYKLKTSKLVVSDGGSRLNCSCTHSVLYAEIADANLVLYDREGGRAIDRMSR